MLSKKSRKTVFACRRFCKRLSDAYEALWSPSCDSTWSLTSASAGCTSGAEKLFLPARKTFFDSIDPKQPSAHKGPQMLDERARLRGTPAMGRHEGVDRQRRTAPSGERLDEHAALEIVADQQFGREADP